MSLIREDIKCKSFLNYPTLFGGEENPVCLLQPLSVDEVIKLGLEYRKALGLLTLSEDELEDILTEKFGAAQYAQMQKVSPFSYLMESALYDQSFCVELTKAFSTFIKDKVFIVPKNHEVYIGEDLELGRKITEDNFEEFQEILRLQNRLEVPEEIPENENAMHRKFRLKRKMLRKAKAKQSAKREDAPNMSDLLAALCVGRSGMSIKELREMSIYAFYTLFSTMQLKEKYDLDVRSLLAGADSKKIKLKYWVRNTDKDTD